jgi:hypothetical protein
LATSDWLVGGELDFVKRGSSFQLHRFSAALAKRNLLARANGSDDEVRVKLDVRNGITQTGRLSLLFGHVFKLSPKMSVKVSASTQAIVYPVRCAQPRHEGRPRLHIVWLNSTHQAKVYATPN